MNTPVPPDKEEIAEVLQLTPHEIHPVRPNKADIAKVRQFVTKPSEFSEGRHAFV